MDETTRIIRWTLSAPVLAHRLRMIATDDLFDAETHQELICTVVDMLDPRRGQRWTEILRATGAQPEDAEALWSELGEDGTWMHRVRWGEVHQALVDRAPLE